MATNRSTKAAGLNSYPSIAVALTVLGLAVAFALLYWLLVQGANRNHADAMALRHASALASHLDGGYERLRNEVLGYARASQTIAALLAKDEAARQDRMDNLAAIVLHARRVEIVARGTARVDLDAATPVSFAALDLIRRAENADFVGPEMSANPRNVVFVAAPIKNAGSVIGVLFVAYDLAYFGGPLGAFDPGLGLAQIEQKFESSPAMIGFTFGQGDAHSEPLRLPLKMPGWTLLFSGGVSDRGAASVASPQQLLLPALVALGLALGGIGLAFNRLFVRMHKDSQTLGDYAAKLLRGRSPNLDRYKLETFARIAGKLASENAAPPPVAPVVAGTTTADEDGPLDLGEHDSAPEANAAAVSANKNAKTDSDEDFLDLLDDEEPHKELQAADNFGIGVSEGASPIDMGLKLDQEIFRAYDIRGVVEDTLTEEVVYWIGRAFAAQAIQEQQSRAVVGHDGRLSSPALSVALIRGLREGGLDMVDIGQAATPMLYFATHALNIGTGIMITGSHNPPQYNGLKMMIGGTTLAEDSIMQLHQRIVDDNLNEGASEGELELLSIDGEYRDRILDDIVIAQPQKIVVDCGNGVAGGIAPQLLAELGCEVIPLYCEVDGTFPNHHPDPADPKNLEDLITVVKAESADLGIAFDGDGDRLGIVTGTGEIIWPDKLMMLFARDIVGRNPGADVIYDVKCSRHLNNVIAEAGGRPIMWKTGHSHIKAKLKETGALLGGEFSGHIIFTERWYGFDDAIYAAARLLEIIGSQTLSADELFAEFPATESTPEIKIETTDRAKFQIMKRIKEIADFGDGTITDIDGIRVDYADGWGLIRPSNTSPVLTLRFEADDAQALTRVQQVFRQQLAKVDGSLKF